MPPSKKHNEKCKLWFCNVRGYVSKDGYCAKHDKQFERTGDPLAGSDAQTLNRMCQRLIRIDRQLLEVAVWVDRNDIAHCRVCDSHSAPHDNIQHKPGCAVLEAKEVLLQQIGNGV